MEQETGRYPFFASIRFIRLAAALPAMGSALRDRTNPITLGPLPAVTSLLTR